MQKQSKCLNRAVDFRWRRPNLGVMRAIEGRGFIARLPSASSSDLLGPPGPSSVASDPLSFQACSKNKAVSRRRPHTGRCPLSLTPLEAGSPGATAHGDQAAAALCAVSAVSMGALCDGASASGKAALPAVITDRSAAALRPCAGPTQRRRNAGARTSPTGAIPPRALC